MGNLSLAWVSTEMLQFFYCDIPWEKNLIDLRDVQGVYWNFESGLKHLEH